MFFHQRFVPGLAIYSYMVGDEKSRQCAVIDPTRDVEEYLEIARREGLRITHVLETHVHADFVSGSVELKSRLGDEVQVVVSGMGGEEWTPPYADRVVGDGDEIALGGVRLKAIHTPGHTYEHVSWALFDDTRSQDTPWLIFTGDFLFVGDVGRPDLLGEEARKTLAHQLYESVFGVLPVLPDFTEVYPAHGAGSLCGKAIGSRSASSVGYERRFSGALRERAEPEWVDTLLKGMPIAPPYFRRMKKVNAEGPKVLGPEPPGQKRFTAKEVHERVCEHCLVLDVRPKEAFAAAHIPGSDQHPAGPQPADLGGLGAALRPPDPDRARRPGRRAGGGHAPDPGRLRRRAGLPGGGPGRLGDARLRAGPAGDRLGPRAARTASRARLPPVRARRPHRGEWDAGHIEGALHIHGGKLEERYAEVPKDRPVAVVCGSGYRASIASSFLKREGYKDVTNVLGGMAAWKAAGLPTVKD